MKYAIAILTLATAIATAQEIDPGWDRRSEYIAQTGDTACNYAAVIAWEAANPKPEVRTRGMQFVGAARVEVSAADGHIYGLEVDPDGDAVVPIQRESTRLTAAQYEAARASNLTARAEHRARIAAIKTDLDQVEAALDQIDVSPTGPMGAALTALNAVDLSAGGPLGTAIAATSGTTKTALQQVRLALVAVRDNAQTAVTESRKAQADTKTATKNLRQACEKLRRDVR